MKLKGLYTALVTPFNNKGEIDKEGLRRNLRYQIEHDVDGIVVLGTTGETPTLSEKEKQLVIEIAVEEIKGKAILMVGTGTYSTDQTIIATQQAQDMGADVALIVTPYYNKPTQEGLYLHYKAICEAVSIPICIYNIQGRTGQNLQTETLKRLISYSSIIGVKEASGNILQINDVLEKQEKDYSHFGVMSGDDALALPLIALGGHGVISVVSNLVPGAMQRLVKAALSGDFIQARQWHYQLLPLFKAIFIETNPIPIKAAMNSFGMAAGSCRLPLCDLKEINMQILKQVLNTLPSSWLGHYGQTKSSRC